MKYLRLFCWITLGACLPKQTPVEAVVTESLNAEAVAGVSDPRLRQLLSDHWEATLAGDPIWATQLGDHRYDDRLPDVGRLSREQWTESVRSWSKRAGVIRLSPLNADDRMTLEIFQAQLDASLAEEVCRFPEFNFSATNNPVASLNYIGDLQTPKTVEEGNRLVARMSAGPAYVRQHIDNLRLGVMANRVGNAASTGRTIEMVETQLGQPIEEWPMASLLKAPESFSATEAEEYTIQMRGAIEALKPAFEEYRNFLRDEVLPIARPDDKAGLSGLPDGDACYRAAILRHTSLPKTPDELHATGLRELERIHAEMLELGAKTLGTSDLPSLFQRLREDKALYYTDAEGIETKAAATLARAKATIPAWFGRLPQTDCIVSRIPDYEAPYTYIAYYRPPHPDGTKPGEYCVNTYAPDTRARYDAEVLAFHESIPGHHLQIAISQELADTPAFRKNLDATVYVEGWALYTESLADEMGMYSGDLDRLGMLSFDAWRASRLVVDTGLHSKGWSRAQAEQFMLENTPLAPNNIHNEVDRYILWPGQALGYKTGQLEIKRLRREAESALGAGFDVRRFHDVVLESGPVTIPVLERRVREWVARGG